MREETAKKSKRISKAQRQKQKLIITGGLAIILLIVVIIAGIFMFGSCGVDYTAVDTNTVFVLKNGKIVSTDVDAFDETMYDKEKLGAYVQDVVDTYNEKNGEKSLKQKSFAVEEGKVNLVLEYANAKVYEDINGVETFIGTIKEAQDAGYTFEETFAKMEEGKAVIASADDFVEGEDYKVVIIKSNTKVIVPGEVCFVSTQNISEVGEDYVLIKDGSQLLVEEITVDTEFGTEAEGSDGSISEEELANGDGSIIFDFGEEEKEEISQYSEVLTYIIYK